MYIREGAVLVNVLRPYDVNLEAFDVQKRIPEHCTFDVRG